MILTIIDHLKPPKVLPKSGRTPQPNQALHVPSQVLPFFA
jgi:hypothetical protein